MGLYCALCGRNVRGSETGSELGIRMISAGPHYLVLGLGQVDSGLEEVLEAWALD